MEFVTRSKPMTREALKLLLDLIDDSGDKILNKNCKATHNKIKEEAWNHIKNVFDANGHGYSLDQIKLKWDNLKKVARKRATKIYENKKNGLGKDYIRPDETLDRVISLMAREGPRISVKDELDDTGDKSTRTPVDEVQNGDDPLVDDDYGSDLSDDSYDRPGPSRKRSNSPKIQNDTHESVTSLMTVKKGSRKRKKKNRARDEESVMLKRRKDRAIAEYYEAKTLYVKKKIEILFSLE